MNKLTLGFVILIYFVLFSCRVVYASTDKMLPEIVDYYPNCSYQVLRNYTVKVETDEPKSPKVNAKLLKQLRQKAQKIGADAVILLKKNTKIVKSSMQSTGGQHLSTYRLSYEAELIKQCIELNSKNRKLSPINHLGERAVSIKSKIQINTTMAFTFPKQAKLVRPKLNNREVSLTNGVYGLKIGADYQQVISAFGVPSVTLLLQEKELIIGYGRHHWLYFQADKLVKIQTAEPFLSKESLNMVPYLAFFDDYGWEINTFIKRKASLAEVNAALETDFDLNKQNQLLLKNDNNTLALNFIVSKSTQNQEISYSLNGFTLQANNYQTYSTPKVELQGKQYAIVEQAYLKLLDGQSVNWQTLDKQLGPPIGRITLSINSQLNIYNSHLIVQTKKSELTAIYLNESVFTDNEVTHGSPPWQLGHFTLGKTHEKLSADFPTDAYIADDEVIIEKDNYSLSLFFRDINGQNSLYQAEVSHIN